MNDNELFKNISQEEIQFQNEKQIRENKEMFEDFQKAYKKKCCSLCGNKLDYFDIDEECFHWFLLPIGIKKKHFRNYLKTPIGYFKLESYFRWMSTLEKSFKNINDLSTETSKLKEITIKYKNLEWSLNYGETDLEGHKNSENANFPHFHLQILKDNLPFISFNNFHIPFSENDIKSIKLEKENIIKFSNSQGAGMSIVEDIELIEELEDHLKVSENMDSALLKTSNMVIMPDGKKLSKVEFLKIKEESVLTKIPMRNLFKKYYPDAQIITEITPADGYPDKKGRNKR